MGKKKLKKKVSALYVELTNVERRAVQLQAQLAQSESERQWHQDKHAQVLASLTQDGVMTPEAKADTEAAYQRGLDAGRAVAGPSFGTAHALDVAVGRALLPSLMALQALEEEVIAVNKRVNDAYHAVSALVNPQEQPEPFTVVTAEEAADLAAGAEAFANGRRCFICRDPDDHHGVAHSEATGDRRGRFGLQREDGSFPTRDEDGAEVFARLAHAKGEDQPVAWSVQHGAACGSRTGGDCDCLVEGGQLASEHCGGTLGHSRHERSNGVICPGTTVRRV